MSVQLFRDVNPYISSRKPTEQCLMIRNSGSLELRFRAQTANTYFLGSKPSFTSCMTYKVLRTVSTHKSAQLMLYHQNMLFKL